MHVFEFQELRKHLSPMYQPNEEHMPESMMTFEVFHSLEEGKQRFPEVPADAWMTLEPGAIEEPSFLD